ncbi:MAG: sensor domain-containing diguanylate cyclase [Synergistales bacterium]|nr:sensor domain-containing diguanylate cyclase [Synergistales bacterium]
MKEEALRNSDLYKRMLDTLYDGVYVVDTERKIHYWNMGAERITGYRRDEVYGRHCSDNILVHVDNEGNNLCLGMCPLAFTLQDGKMREADVYLHHKEGHRVPVSIRISPIEDDKGEIIGAVEIFSNNSEKLAALELAESYYEMSITDQLTKAGNRRYSDISLLSAIDEYQNHHLPFGVLFIDLDHLREINDRLGHYAGDRALRMLALTVASDLQSFDFVGRWGDDEFLVILGNYTCTDKLAEKAEHLRMLIENSFFQDSLDNIVRGTASIGGTIVQEEDNLDRLLQRADEALYASKKRGNNTVTIR